MRAPRTSILNPFLQQLGVVEMLVETVHDKRYDAHIYSLEDGFLWLGFLAVDGDN